MFILIFDKIRQSVIQDYSEEELYHVEGEITGMLMGETTSLAIQKFAGRSLLSTTGGASASPLGPILGFMVGMIIERSSDPSSVLYLDNSLFAKAYETSVESSNGHPLQVSGREREENLYVLSARIIDAVECIGQVRYFEQGSEVPIYPEAGHVVFKGEAGYDILNYRSVNDEKIKMIKAIEVQKVNRY